MYDHPAGPWLGPVDEELKLYDAATKAATGNSDVVDLGENFAPAPDHPIKVELDVDTVVTDDGDETYQFELYESADGVTYTSTGLVFSVAAAGTVVKTIGVTKRYQRLTHTLAGTTPSITLSGWLGRH